MFSSNHPSRKRTHPFSQDPSLVLSRALTQGHCRASPQRLQRCHPAPAEWHTTGQGFTSYIKTVLAISDCFPNFYIIWGGKRWSDRKKEHSIRVGPAPKLNLGRTDILTPSQWGWPLPPLIHSFHKYFLSSRHCSNSWDTCSLGDNILLGGIDDSQIHLVLLEVHKDFPVGLHTSREHCTLPFHDMPSDRLSFLLSPQ